MSLINEDDDDDDDHDDDDDDDENGNADNNRDRFKVRIIEGLKRKNEIQNEDDLRVIRVRETNRNKKQKT